MKEFLDDLIDRDVFVVNNSDTAKKFLRQAYHYAAAYSHDSDTKTGAIFVRNERVIMRGANRFADGIEVTPERLKRPTKYDFMICAEQYGVLSAARDGVKMKDSHMYMPWIPCLDCVDASHLGGIEGYTAHYSMIAKTPIDWKDQLMDSVKALQKRGMNLYIVTDKIGDCGSLMRGELWFP